MEASLAETFRGRFGKPLRHLDSTDSTNSEAFRWASEPEGAPHGALVLADEQTAGRGRWDRKWVSAPGASLLMSLVVRPAQTSSDLGIVPLLAGLACAEAIEDLGFDHAAIKWPNDVLVGGSKVCGILTESRSVGTDRPLVVIGIGVNLKPVAGLPPEVKERATDLETAGSTFGVASLDRGGVIRAILLRLESRWEDFIAGETERLVSDIERRLDILGARIEVRTLSGERVEGVARSLASSGSLVVATPSGIREISSGEVERA